MRESGLVVAGPSAIRACLLDFDGTICDTERAAYRSWALEYARSGLDFPLPLWHAMTGRPEGEELAWADLAAKAGPEATVRERRAARAEAKLRLCLREPLRPGVARLLRAAAEAGVALAVVSSSGRDWVERHLNRLGVAQCFVALVTGGGDVATKPAPDLYLRALAELRVAAAGALAFEDSPTGIRAAAAAEIRCVATPSEFGPRSGLELAEWVLESLDEVVDWTGWLRLNATGWPGRRHPRRAETSMPGRAPG
jgi:HAD superfamily hydrolase (TIGR01509 family)